MEKGQNKTVQVLVAAMWQTDHSLLDKMNIQSSAIIGNQCDRNLIEDFDWKGNQILFLNFNERGVGQNRNNTLIRADADYCLFADDDMVYVDDYPQIVIDAFRCNPSADVIIFNLHESISNRYQIKRRHHVHCWNYMRYGTARIAVKLKSIKEQGIYFNQCFGGGTEYSHGEDTLFLSACLKHGLSIIALPITIASLLNDRESTWATKPEVEYLRDQGKLYSIINRRWWRLLCLQDVLRHRTKYKMNVWACFTTMLNGAKR